MIRTTILSLFLTLFTSALGAAEVKVTFVTPSIVRVQWSPDGRLPGNATGVCVYSPRKVRFRKRQQADTARYSLPC